MHIEPLERRRLLDAGGLDPYFGTGGFLRIPASEPSEFQATMLVEPDGGILFAYVDTKQRMHLLRFSTDGVLDTRFGGQDGNSPGHVSLPHDRNDLNAAASLHPLEGGRFLARRGRNIYRFNQNGSLDTAFGSGGRATAPVPSPLGFGVLGDGSILVTGSRQIDSNSRFIISRLRPDGSRDTQFGTSGVLDLEYNPRLDGATDVNTFGGSVFATAEGGAHISGSYHYQFTITNCTELGCFTEVEEVRGTIITRVRSDGSFDTAFGGDGVIDIDRGFDSVFVAGRLNDDEFLVGGASASGDRIYRVALDGTVDDGIDLCADGVCEGTVQVLVQHRGDILALRESLDLDGVFSLVRVNPDGTQDLTFRQSELAPFVSSERPLGMTFARDGSILVLTQQSGAGLADSPELLIRRLWRDDAPVATMKVDPIITSFALRSHSSHLSRRRPHRHLFLRQPRLADHRTRRLRAIREVRARPDRYWWRSAACGRALQTARSRWGVESLT